MSMAESRAGGTLTEYAAALSRDAKFLFVCAGTTVRVYSVHTGSLIQTLSGHTASITCVMQSADDAQRIYSFSLDGTIKSWSWETGKLLQTFNAGFPIDACARCEGSPKAFYIATKKRSPKAISASTDAESPKKENRPGRVGRFEFSESGGKFVHLFESSKITTFAASKDWIAVSHKKKLTLYHIASKTMRRLKHTRQITSLAFHPLDGSMFTGELNGNITCWQSLSQHGRDEPVLTTQHWHAHACRALAVTPDGAYVLSGGDESVLVIWQLASGKKTFVPRIGHAAITSIQVAADSSLYVISVHDNSLRIINAFSMKQEQVIQGIKNALLPADWRPLVGLVADPKTSALVTNGYPGFAFLQFYDVLTDTHVADFEVEPQSIAIRGAAYEMRVEHVAFSGDGNACATVDRYYSAYGSSGPCTLKFWSRTSQAQPTFLLNSRTDAAHKEPITAIAYHPREHLVVTAARDRKFKVWVRVQRDKSKETNPSATPNYSWQCRSVGFYHNLHAEALAFSTDGSLLAVAYGAVLTLWDPTLNMLKHTLTHTHSQDVLRRVQFISNSPFIVGCTDYDLIVWNLLSGVVWWSYRLHATSLAVDPRSTRFAVAASSDALNADLLFVFAAENPKPLRITRFAGGTRLREVVWLPDSQAQASALAFRTSDQFYSVVRDASAVELPRATNLPVANADASSASLFAQLIPEVEVAVEVETDERAALPLLPQNSEPLPGITGMSSHTLPSVQDMFDTFFDRMVALRHPATEASEQQEEEAKEDVPILYKEKNKTLPVQPADALQSGELEDEAEVDVAEEDEESFFDMDEMVAYIKQLKLSEPAADEALLDTQAKAKKAKKKEQKEENEVKNAVETTTPVKSKGKREKATDDVAETVASEARKTPRRKESKEDQVMAEDDDASTASARRSTRNVEKKEEEKKDEKKQDKKQVDDEESTKTPRRRGRAATAEKKQVAAESERDDEASTASLRRSTRHAPPEKKKEEDDETSNAGIARRSTRQRKTESDGEDEASATAAAGEAKTPRRRGRSATEKEDESELSDAKASKQRSRSTRSQSTSEKNAGTKSPRKGQK